MLGVSVACLAFLAALLLISLFVKPERRRLLQFPPLLLWFVYVNYSVSFVLGPADSFFLFPVFAIVFCLHFFVTDFVEYRQNKDDPVIARRTVRHAAVYLGLVVAVLLSGVVFSLSGVGPNPYAWFSGPT